MNKTLNNLLSIVVFLYVFISQIMTFVFFLQFCRTDSIGEIIFIDSWLSEIKGLLWIFFI